MLSARVPKFCGNADSWISQPGVRYTHPNSPCATSSLLRSRHATREATAASGLYGVVRLSVR